MHGEMHGELNKQSLYLPPNAVKNHVFHHLFSANLYMNFIMKQHDEN